MDFFGFGYLKQRMWKKRPKTMDSLWKLMKKEWLSVSQKLIDKVYNSWKRRLRLVAKISGEHIEHVKHIHLRKKYRK